MKKGKEDRKEEKEKGKRKRKEEKERGKGKRRKIRQHFLISFYSLN